MPHQLTCQVCGGSDRKQFIAWNRMELFQCQDCGLVWLDPLPDPAGVQAIYDDAYDGATSSYFGKVARKLKRSRGRVRYIVGLLPGGAGGKTFLDVGANGGFMAEAARQAGFTVTGLEPDPVSVAYARKNYSAITMLHGLLEDCTIAPQGFDVAYCSEVIEHTTDCNRFVAKLASVLRPGGLLYLTTPDISHWRRPKQVELWDGFCPPSHCLYFNPKNLAMLLHRHGFNVIKKRFAWKPGIKIIAQRRAS